LHRPATVGSTLKMQIKPIRLANYPVHALRRLGNEQSLRHLALAFAVAGYSSFWLILAMWVLMALVGVNYMAICRVMLLGQNHRHTSLTIIDRP
jgi:hypothetical protein